MRVSHAFHSPHMEPAAPRLAAELAAVPFRPPARPVASTVTGALLSPESDLPALLLAQLTAPVRFTAALAAAGGADLWIEVGPGRALSELAGESLAAPVIPLDVGGSSISGLLAAAGAAFALGVPVDTGVLFAGRLSRPFDPERPLKFLANPCETAPVMAAGESRPAPRTLTPGPSPGKGFSDPTDRTDPTDRSDLIGREGGRGREKRAGVMRAQYGMSSSSSPK